MMTACRTSAPPVGAALEARPGRHSAADVGEQHPGAEAHPQRRAQRRTARPGELTGQVAQRAAVVDARQAVRTERWKLIHYTDLKDCDELYDLQNDKYEMKNLIEQNTPSKERS